MQRTEWLEGAIVTVCEPCWDACGYDDSLGAMGARIWGGQTCSRCHREVDDPDGVPAVQFVIPCFDAEGAPGPAPNPALEDDPLVADIPTPQTIQGAVVAREGE